MLKEKISILFSAVLVSSCSLNAGIFKCTANIPTPSYSSRNFPYYYNNIKKGRAEIRTRREHTFMLNASGRCH